MGLTLVNLNEIGNIKTHTTGGYIDSDINYRRRELDAACEFIDTPSDYDGATHDGLPFIDNNDYKNNASLLIALANIYRVKEKYYSN